MKLDGAVALVVGADSAVGAAIVHGLIARDVAKVYAASFDLTRVQLQSSAGLLRPEPDQSTDAGSLALDLHDVTLLVVSMVAVPLGTSSLGGSDIQPLGRRMPPLGRTMNLIDAFAPVLAINGGGAVVNVLSVLCSDQPAAEATPKIDHRAVDWMLADSLRGRLAAQRTQLLYFQAQLALGGADRALGDQRALALHVATRVLGRLEDGVLRDRTYGISHPHGSTPMTRTGRRHTHEHTD